MKFFSGVALLLSAVFLCACVPIPAAAQQARNAAEFCGSHFGICVRTCPGGDCRAECQRRQSTCRSNGGCFYYGGGPGTQCFSNTTARAKTDLKLAPNPEAARRARERANKQ